MSIINLHERITRSLDEYEKNKMSEKSFIYVDVEDGCDTSSHEVLLLLVGDTYFVNSQQINIPQKGLVIKPGESKVIETKQEIAIPLNVMGTIHGVGVNIYQNGFVATGKIDQGYRGHLKIAFYNGGKNNLTFKPGDILASVIFFSTEETLQAALAEQAYDRCPSYKMTQCDKIKLFLSNHWIALLSLIISGVALIVDFFK